MQDMDLSHAPDVFFFFFVNNDRFMVFHDPLNLSIEGSVEYGSLLSI